MDELDMALAEVERALLEYRHLIRVYEPGDDLHTPMRKWRAARERFDAAAHERAERLMKGKTDA